MSKGSKELTHRHSTRPVTWFFMMLIKGYKTYISPLHKPCCIYEPSCSTYALQALERYGVLKGGFLSIRRVARCHPFHKGGFDPVP